MWVSGRVRVWRRELELRRSRRTLVLGIAFAVGGLALLLCGFGADSTIGSVVYVVVGGLALLIAIVVVREERRPFRFAIDPHGLNLRARGINRLVPWAEIDAVILDQPVPRAGSLNDRRSGPHLVLVPAAGSELAGRVTAESLSDGRAGLVVLDLDDVKESREQIAAALRTFSGGRFTDALSDRQSHVGAYQFSMVLRGYDPASVNTLVRRAGDALGSGRITDRIAARAQIEAASISVANRGYDRTQVDAALRVIAAQLAGFPSGDERA